MVCGRAEFRPHAQEDKKFSHRKDRSTTFSLILKLIFLTFLGAAHYFITIMQLVYFNKLIKIKILLYKKLIIKGLLSTKFEQILFVLIWVVMHVEPSQSRKSPANYMNIKR